MSHQDALEASRRALGSRPDCEADLVDLGPDQHFEGCTLWACSVCRQYLCIDPLGIIRDKGPITILEPDRMTSWPPFPPQPLDPSD